MDLPWSKEVYSKHTSVVPKKKDSKNISYEGTDNLADLSRRNSSINIILVITYLTKYLPELLINYLLEAKSFLRS